MARVLAAGRKGTPRSILWSGTNRFAHLLWLGAWMLSVGGAAGGDELPPPLELTAQADHQRMMELLGIEELRRGRTRVIRRPERC